MTGVRFLCLFLISCIGVITRAYGQGYDGCPMYGCRPSGSFSESVKIPERNATIAWINEYFLGPIPNAEGCVGNSLSLVCQSNGPGPADTGLKSYDLATGAVKWRDFVLRFPSLPVMDITGAVWGSDGSNLVSYTAEGKLMMQISLNPRMRPLFGLQVVGEDFILLVSETGEISTLNTDGVPMASLQLKGNVERVDGVFIPTASPVINGNRFYVITQFVPNNHNYSLADLGLQRLYAIDTFHSMSDRMAVAWYANFERENAFTWDHKYTSFDTKTRDLKAELIAHLRDPSERKPSILWDKTTDTIYVALPPPALTSSVLDASQFVGIKDTGNDSALVFRDNIPVVNLAMFEVNFQPVSNAVPQLWGSLPDGKLIAFTNDGRIERRFDMSGVFKTNFTITTKISITRPHNYDEDFLIFGIQIKQSTEAFKEFISRFGVDPHDDTVTSFVVALDTPENEILEDPGMPVKWMVPCPEGSIPYGQIVGVPAAGNRAKDMLVVFSQIEGKFGKVFTITEK